jgi:hypothetical protein
MDYATVFSVSNASLLVIAAAYTSPKMDINTGSRGAFVPEIKPVQKIRDKSPPSLVPVPYKPVLKRPPRWLQESVGLGTFGTGL